MDKKLYLKPNIVFEPPVNKRYALRHPIFSAAAVMKIAGIFHPQETHAYPMVIESLFQFINSIKYTGGYGQIVQLNKPVELSAQTSMNTERLYEGKEHLYEKETIAV